MKRLIDGALCLTIAIALAAPARAQPDAARRGTNDLQKFKAAQVAYEKGVKQFAKKDWEAARHAARDSVARFSDYSDAYLLLAKSAYMLKDYDDALQAIGKAESSFDALVALRGSLVGDRQEALYRQRVMTSDSINEMQEALLRGGLTDSEREAIRIRLDELNRRQQDIDRQIQAPDTAGQPGLPAEYPFVHGNILLRMNRLAEAEPQYKKALEIQPKYPEAINNLASLYLSAGRAELALVVIDDAEAHGVTVNPELKKAVMEAAK